MEKKPQRTLDYDNATEEEREEFRRWAFENCELDEEELWYEDHFDEFVPAPEWVGKSLREAARRPAVVVRGKKPGKNPKKAVSLRLETEDIAGLKSIAREQGLQYQTLIGSILHRFVAGLLVDVNEARKIAGRAGAQA